jgi:CelD/BcsL family acetyltransferase involved in cellulose biosynthesis
MHPLSFELAAVEVVGCDGDQSRDLLAAQAVKLGQKCNQRAGQHRSDARHRGEHSTAVGERGIGRSDLDQALIELPDVADEPRDAAARKTRQHRIFQQSGGILGSDFLLAELATNGDHLGELFDRRRLRLRRTRRHDGDERRDSPRVEPTVLGENSAGIGETAEA